MWLSSILNSLRPSSPPTRKRRRPSRRQRPAARRLTLEALEDRMLLSYTFTPIADTSPGSPFSGFKGWAINNLGDLAFQANLRSGGEVIYERDAHGGELTTIATTGDLISTFVLNPYMND